MSNFCFYNGQYRIFPDTSYMNNAFVEIKVHRRKDNSDDVRFKHVESVPVLYTESIKDVFDRVVKKYTQQ